MLKRRCAAAAVDLLVQGSVGLTLGALVSRSGPHSVYVALAVAIAWFFVADIGLHSRAGAHRGQSFGKQLLRIRVVAPGSTAGEWRMTARPLIRWLGGLASIGMFSDAAGSPISLTHDRLLRTRVIAAKSRTTERDDV